MFILINYFYMRELIMYVIVSNSNISIIHIKQMISFFDEIKLNTVLGE